MSYEIVDGNLFECKAEAYVNTVNCVGISGKGIALTFKTKYPLMFKHYKSCCNKNLVKPGEMLVYDLGDDFSDPRYIINFPTKRHWRQNSFMEDIKSGLIGLRKSLKEFGIKTVAIPALGCSNGGLDWRLVKPYIAATFLKCEEHAFLYAPKEKT